MEFTDMQACIEIKKFISSINSSIQTEKQEKNNSITNILSSIQNILDSVPPKKAQNRFGNIAFCDFHSAVIEKAPKLLEKEHLLFKDTSFIKYLIESFGNKTRIDYGTGHELNFLCFLYCLNRENKVKINECFYALCMYFDLTRNIILKYNLEAAGSHGVWGIDDYQILPFLLGSAELFESRSSFDDFMGEIVIKDGVSSNLCFAKSLAFVESQKSGGGKVPMSMHSPMLYALRKLSWMRVNYELMGIFEKDVLASFAVNQHFIFTDYLTNEIIENDL